MSKHLSSDLVITPYENSIIKKFVRCFLNRSGEKINPEVYRLIFIGNSTLISKLIAWLIQVSALLFFCSSLYSNSFLWIVGSELLFFLLVISHLIYLNQYYFKNIGYSVVIKHDSKRLTKQIQLCQENNINTPADYSRTISTLNSYQQFLNMRSRNGFKIFKTIFNFVWTSTGLAILTFILHRLKEINRESIILWIALLSCVILFSISLFCFFCVFFRFELKTKNKIQNVEHVKKDLKFLMENLFLIYLTKYSLNEKFLKNLQKKYPKSKKNIISIKETNSKYTNYWNYYW